MKALVCLWLLLGSLQALAAPSSTGNGATVPWDLSKPLNGITFERVKAVKPPTPDRPAPRFSRLHNIKGKPGSFTSVSALGRLLKTPPAHHQHVYQNVSATGDFSTQYAIQCGWDGVPLWLLFDTGSSDTWAVKTGFRCNDGVGGGNDQEVCGFGSPTIDEFSGGAIEDLHFLLKYGSGEQIVGPMGYSDLTCGGVHVARQQVGLANDTYWHGNNLTVGILGLAYPSLTSAFYGEVGSEATWNAISYTPFFTNAITQGTIDPVFSVAILKNSSEGMLAWGGLPPMDWRRGGSAETDLIIANLIGQAETAWRYSFYTIIPDGIKWGQSTDTTKFPYIVDTGTTMNYLPPPLAEQIAMAFQPRAVYLYQWGAYFAPCNAIPPRFAIIISGVEFWINPADLMYQDLKDPLTGYCAVAIASGGAGPYILGDVFLQNVVAVFDVGAAKMRFYSR